MARVIVCAGKRTKHPLIVSGDGIKLFSAEEICYFLYHNTETAEEFLADKTLADFYEKELALPETAKRLRMLDASEASPKEYATVLFGDTPMYTAEEIEEFLEGMERYLKLPDWQKKKAKADRYLERRNFRLAAGVYESLLASRKELELTDRTVGNLFHNFAICELHTTGPGTAAVHFADAYEKNHSTESLRSYLMALRLAKRDGEYSAAIEKYEISEDLISQIDTILLSTVLEAGETPEYQRLVRVKKMLSEGQVNEYRQEIEKMLVNFKKMYRQDNT